MSFTTLYTRTRFRHSAGSQRRDSRLSTDWQLGMEVLGFVGVEATSS
jgi:hypothetical protein